MTFAEIFDSLLIPRQNGSEALGQVATWIEKVSRSMGADVVVHDFTCRPYELRILGAVVLLLAIGFTVAIWRRRFGWAFGCALAIPAYLLLELEYYVPLISALFSSAEQNIVLSFPVTDPLQTVILGAHYDTKTDLFGHYQRIPIHFLLIPVAVVTIAIAISGWRRWRQEMSLAGVRVAAVIVLLYYFTFFLSLTAGAFMLTPSPGAIDDGASVALLLRVAEALGSNEVKLEHTDVKIIFFAGEETDTQGSRAYVEQQYPQPPRQRIYFINAEGLGYGPDVRYFTSDRFILRRYEAAGALVHTLDTAYRDVTARGLAPDELPISTDARNFMAAGIPSICLTSIRGNDEIVRGVHSASDSVDRIDVAALERTLRFYKQALVEMDRAAAIKARTPGG